MPFEAGVGIASMKERVSLIGAKLEISRNQGGTSIVVTVKGGVFGPRQTFSCASARNPPARRSLYDGASHRIPVAGGKEGKTQDPPFQTEGGAPRLQNHHFLVLVAFARVPVNAFFFNLI
jgi:hypothetical protein